MRIDTTQWSREAQNAFEQNRNQLMPLVRSEKSCEAGQRLLKTLPGTIFPDVRLPDCVLAGVLLHLGCWTEAHQIAQNVDATEGSYWHAILHRMEPDGWNANYWFRRVGAHPIYPKLHSEALRLAQNYPSANFSIAGAWKPEEFIRFCERAAASSGSAQEKLAQEIQQAEWELLLNWCIK